jgi:hypothetical protein
MKEYMFIVRGGNMPEKDSPAFKEHIEKWNVWMKGLSEQGKLKSGLPLANEGKMLASPTDVKDGYYGDNDTMVGGYLFVTADSLDGAAEIAKGCPAYEVGGTVEVRTTVPMNM